MRAVFWRALVVVVMVVMAVVTMGLSLGWNSGSGQENSGYRCE